MRMMSALAILSLLAIGQSNDQQGTRTSSVEELGSRILRNDSEAVRAAFDSGDTRFIPYLKRALEGVKPDGSSKTWEDSGTSRVIQMTLVKLGDAETEQAFWCWLIRDSVVTEVTLLDSIGGWFSIQALDAVLGGAGHAAFERAVRRIPPTDVSYAAPITFALETLPKIVHDGPPQSTGARDRIADWHAWIADHRDALKTLKPTGEGVNFTEAACQDGKPK